MHFLGDFRRFQGTSRVIRAGFVGGDPIGRAGFGGQPARCTVSFEES